MCRTYTSELFHTRDDRATAVFTHQPQQSFPGAVPGIVNSLASATVCGPALPTLQALMVDRHAGRHGNGAW